MTNKKGRMLYFIGSYGRIINNKKKHGFENQNFVPNAEDSRHKLRHGRRSWTQRSFTALQEQDSFDKTCQCNFF
jgi:hypothetical protein